MARLSLCLLALTSAAVLWAAPVAQAAPPIPLLTGTSPASPSTDLSPFVDGSSTGVIKSSLPFAHLSAIGFGGEGEAGTILLFTNANCEGSPAKEGSAEALDITGIQVTVNAETTTFISARQREGAETSGCSAAIAYQQVKELPPPTEGTPGGGGGGTPPGSTPPPSGKSSPPGAPHLRTVPGGRANDNTPLVTGTSPGAATVRIFTNPECTGAPVARGSLAQFEAGLEVQVVNNVQVAFYGIAVGPGGAQSRCSDPAYYVEDSTIPHTRITMGPASKTRKRIAVFRFTDTTGDTPGTVFLCKVDRKKWKRCSSPLRLRHLHFRRYKLRVRAIDPAGNTEVKGAKRAFKVIR